MKEGEKYLHKSGAEITLLSYFWPDKEWYIGYKRRVYSRKHDKLKELISIGELIKQ